MFASRFVFYCYQDCVNGELLRNDEAVYWYWVSKICCATNDVRIQKL